ncbi:Meiotic recombination protein rec11 [Bienertia sinuspersici]
MSNSRGSGVISHPGNIEDGGGSSSHVEVLKHTMDLGQNNGIVTKEKQGSNGWTSFIDGLKLPAKGKCLSFISPIVVDGKPQARLSQAKRDEDNAKWECPTFVYVFGDTPTITSLGQFVESEWNFMSKPQIFLYDEGYFIVKFISREDRDEVVFVGPYSFLGIRM